MFIELIVGSMVLCSAVDVDWITPEEPKIPPQWALKKICGRDFWPVMSMHFITPEARALPEKIRPSLIMPLSGLPKEIVSRIDHPAFSTIAFNLPLITAEQVRRNDDGSLSYAPALVPEGITLAAGRPFFTSPQRLTRKYKKVLLHEFFFENYRHDQKAYQKWKKEHPGFVGANALIEWGNETRTLYATIKRWEQGNKKPFTPEEMEKIRQMFPEALPTRRDYVEKRLKPYFDRCAQIWFNDPSGLYAFEGMWCIGHLAAYWGAGIIGIETSRAYTNWQFQMMCIRGAARQFHIPWAWYVASFLTAPDSKGKKMTDSEPTAEKPELGISASSIRRAFYMAYLSGANFFEREDNERNYWNQSLKYPENWEPAPEAKMYFDFYGFTRENPNRGVPFTPVALLVPHDRGASRVMIPPFNLYSYTPADNTLDAVIGTLLPCGEQTIQQKKGMEVTLRNGKYGDIFDVLTPDFADTKAFASVISAYRAALLIGEYQEHPGMVEALMDFVRGGGTLIMNAAQINRTYPASFTGVSLTGKFFEEKGYLFFEIRPEGAEILEKDGAGRIIFTAHKFGKGKVIVAAPKDLVPQFDPKSRAASKALSQTACGSRKFPYIEKILSRIVPPLLPAKVKGDIQYGFNKTSSGWWIYLFNNKGITKFPDLAEEIDPAKKAAVSVEFTHISAKRVTELITGKTIPVVNGKCAVTVELGRIAVLKTE